MTNPLYDIIRRLTALERRAGRVETRENPGIGARVYRSTVQSLTTGTDTAISFNTERYDTAELWVVGQPTRLTAPIAGWYLIGGTIGFAANADTNMRQLILYLNGATAIAGHNEPAVTGVVTRINAHAIYQLAASDYVEMVGRQNSGGNLNTEALSAVATEFWMHRLG